MNPAAIQTLHELYPDRLQEQVPLAGYTSARIGGPADMLLIVRSAEELAEAAAHMWQLDVPVTLLGGGSNVLVSDRGVRGMVLINRARLVKVDSKADLPSVYAESGASLNDIAQRTAKLGLSGLEWAAALPGSLGGAIFGNTGAFGGDMAGNVVSVEVLHRERGRETWPVEKMGYGYRTSILKREPQPVFILAATLQLLHGVTAKIQAKMTGFSERRRCTQPPGASMGSMFKNPPGDKAGRLIEAAGLKGSCIGAAQVSTQHANFFINTADTRAEDMKSLLDLVQATVFSKFGIHLETEVELIGEW